MKKRLFIPEVAYCFVIYITILFPTLGYSQEDVAKYPSRPITFIHPFTAGGVADLAIRLITKEAEQFLGQPIVVVNKAGGVGAVGVAAIASSKPDGYTIGNTPQAAMILVPHLEKLPYHPIKDLKMIMQFSAFNMGVAVKGDSSFKNFRDLISFARQNPKKLTYGTTGVNSMQAIIMEHIAKVEKVEITNIPFKSTFDSQTALLGGHILAAAGDLNYSLIGSGKIRLLVLLNEERAEEYPDTPILKDTGYNFPIPSFICVSGPKGLPDGIVKKLESAYTKAIRQPAFIKGMKELRSPIVYRNSDDFGEYVARSYEVYGRMLKDMGLIK